MRTKSATRGETLWMVVLTIVFSLAVLVLALIFAPRGDATDSVTQRYESLSAVDMVDLST